MKSRVPFRHARKRPGGQVAQESEGDKSGGRDEIILEDKVSHTRHHLEC